jgi:site-specific recombinase XerD
VTARDETDFRNHLSREKRHVLASVKRCLVTIRRIFDWLVGRKHSEANPAKAVEELRRQSVAPKGLERTDVRKLLGKIELRQDVRAGAILGLLARGALRAVA